MSKSRLWSGRIISGIAVLALTMDAAMKLSLHPEAVKGTIALGYPEHVLFTLGVLGAIGTLLYAIPATSVAGAVWLTGFLGGAVATQVRLEAPLFTHVLAPIYVATFVWGGLVLRYPKLLDAIRPGGLSGDTTTTT
jgi:hypothetical protein